MSGLIHESSRMADAQGLRKAIREGGGLVPVLRGARLQYLFVTFYRPQYWLYAKPDIRSVENPKGKRVGVSSIGSDPGRWISGARLFR